MRMVKKRALELAETLFKVEPMVWDSELKKMDSTYLKSDLHRSVEIDKVYTRTVRNEEEDSRALSEIVLDKRYHLLPF